MRRKTSRLLNRIALNLLKQETTFKRGIKGKRLKAAWDQTYLLKLLGNLICVGPVVENAGGSHAVKLLLPVKDFAAQTRDTATDKEATKKTIVPVEQTHKKMAGGGTPKMPHAGDGSGQALHGNGSDNEDVHPSFPIFSPHPPLKDRSLLPAAEVKVVVDVKVDALGQVLGETLVKGVGNQLDKLCLDIVWTWRFQPATVNGKPVPSEAELIFPFTPSYPISG
jgi:TonB family protein